MITKSNSLNDINEITLTNLKNGEVMLLQNTRYEKGESKNDETLAKNMAKNIDVFVMDAFGSAHRAHSSTYGVPELLNKAKKETAIGFLMEKEISMEMKDIFRNVIYGIKHFPIFSINFPLILLNLSLFKKQTLFEGVDA